MSKTVKAGSVRGGGYESRPPSRKNSGDRSERAAGHERGLPVSHDQARALADKAIQSGRLARRAKGTDQEHEARADHNQWMAQLQQVHTGLHHSVLAINHLEGLQEAGDNRPEIAKQLQEAHQLLNWRLNLASQSRGGR